MSAFQQRMQGFSLVELMISLAIGLIVVAAVLAFTVSSLTANSEYVQATRLSQELRNTMDFVTRELRRAGYDEDIGGAVARYSVTNLTPSPFGRMRIVDNADSDCIIYAYDRSGGTPGAIDLARGEIRAVRRAARKVDGVDVGVLEIAESSAGSTPSCTGSSPDYSNYPATCSGGWCALTDPRVLDITAFNLDTSGYSNQPGTAITAPVTIREIGVAVQARLVQSADGNVTRGVRGTVKVRADCLEASTNCNLTPSGT